LNTNLMWIKIPEFQEIKYICATFLKWNVMTNHVDVTIVNF